MVNQQEIDRVGFSARQRHGTGVFVGHVSDGWFLSGASGAAKVEASAWRKLIDRVYATSAESQEMRSEPLDEEARRRFLSSAGWLCGANGIVCPSCREAQVLHPLGLKSISEVSAR